MGTLYTICQFSDVLKTILKEKVCERPRTVQWQALQVVSLVWPQVQFPTLPTYSNGIPVLVVIPGTTLKCEKPRKNLGVQATNQIY